MIPLQYPNIHQRFPFSVFHWVLSRLGKTKDWASIIVWWVHIANRANGLSLFLSLSMPYFLVKGMLGSEGYWHSDGMVLYKISLLNSLVCWPLFWFQSKDRLLVVRVRKGRKGGWETDHKALSFLCIYKRWTIAKLLCDKIMLHLVSFFLPCDVLI